MMRVALIVTMLLLTACRASWSDHRLQCAPPTDACLRTWDGGGLL